MLPKEGVVALADDAVTVNRPLPAGVVPYEVVTQAPNAMATWMKNDRVAIITALKTKLTVPGPFPKGRRVRLFEIG
jgi:hypothetical protein